MQSTYNDGSTKLEPYSEAEFQRKLADANVKRVEVIKAEVGEIVEVGGTKYEVTASGWKRL